ncbi:hypothetical protein [Vibrio rotiferianus]|uniref:hypothetical protein n=1 Tax=Vibrio rotiferianus TaxID=190895 RepID=UPI0005EF7AC1|nr:hypothetical protein [Vibrio rotiferianus]
MLNFELLNQYMDNDQEIITAVLLTYMEDYENTLQDLNYFNKEHDWQGLFLLSHSLKGILAGFGEKIAVNALENVENKTRDGLAPNHGDITIINTELDLIHKQIRRYLIEVT